MKKYIMAVVLMAMVALPQSVLCAEEATATSKEAAPVQSTETVNSPVTPELLREAAAELGTTPEILSRDVVTNEDVYHLLMEKNPVVKYGMPKQSTIVYNDNAAEPGTPYSPKPLENTNNEEASESKHGMGQKPVADTKAEPMAKRMPLVPFFDTRMMLLGVSDRMVSVPIRTTVPEPVVEAQSDAANEAKTTPPKEKKTEPKAKATATAAPLSSGIVFTVIFLLVLAGVGMRKFKTK